MQFSGGDELVHVQIRIRRHQKIHRTPEFPESSDQRLPATEMGRQQDKTLFSLDQFTDHAAVFKTPGQSPGTHRTGFDQCLPLIREQRPGMAEHRDAPRSGKAAFQVMRRGTARFPVE